MSETLNNTREAERVYMSFLNFFDGVGMYALPSIEGVNSFIMGVTKLEYDQEKNVLHVYVRRPGLLIGKGGRTLNKAEAYLDCKIRVHEVNLLKN